MFTTQSVPALAVPYLGPPRRRFRRYYTCADMTSVFVLTWCAPACTLPFSHVLTWCAPACTLPFSHELTWCALNFVCEAKGAGRVSGTQGSLVAICAIIFLLETFFSFYFLSPPGTTPRPQGPMLASCTARRRWGSRPACAVLECGFHRKGKSAWAPSS